MYPTYSQPVKMSHFFNKLGILDGEVSEPGKTLKTLKDHLHRTHLAKYKCLFLVG